ncbi:NAD(P)H-quinone oxidoreductase subunit F [Synechococcales cyanobacterium C]|uniref:NAD(P)H-quinone oxidoreductase subunit F n=1 Tax=Petrachloros mirabilis ULC683 TaxID=2781853 RepID=A0A8K1ZXL5_9CYAN|nr:NAD(P)H-quinone oxidoreductase subunit F [Petrachloros mirabilis]NCJ05753.1 NAD(P)H-quinone oxidoreductase subunit F [Petrachloros mirabilis ULC683]
MNQFLLQTTYWVPLYGLLGAILTLPWSIGLLQRSGPRPAAYFNLFMTSLGLLHGFFAFVQTLNLEAQEVLWHWLTVADLDFTFAIKLSSVSVGAMELVTLLSLLAQVYALGYLEKDWALARFFALMGFFEAALGGIAISDSLFLTYALLEMLTLSTYLLVGFWYAQSLVVTAARDAFLTKRVGDVLLLMGVLSLSVLAGSLNFPDLYVWTETASLSPTVATLLGLALIAGPTGKCAQFPLHLWLDEAMEGPSPASILRNSIVVSAGAYVLIKLQPILIVSPVASATLVGLGTVTAIGASLVSIAQIDLKRALAHSTSAYLGLVFIAVGFQWSGFALLILFAHGISKALLFMSAGGVTLNTNSQDLTEMGGLGRKMPASMLAFVIGGAGLIGLLPLGGFWAMREGLSSFWYEHQWVTGVIVLVNGLTAINLVRVFRLVFLGSPHAKARRAPEVPWLMAVPMVSLAVITVLLPLMMQRLSLLPGWTYLNQEAVAVLVISGLVGCAIGAGLKLNRSGDTGFYPVPKAFRNLLAYDFYVDQLYRFTVVAAVSAAAKASAWFDRYIVDGVVNLVGFASLMAGEGLRYSISGQSQFYLLTILISVGAIGVFLTWSLW